METTPETRKMAPRKFFTGRAIGLLAVLTLAGIVWGFFALNDPEVSRPLGRV